MEQLTILERQNRRSDRARAEELLAKTRSLRSAAGTRAEGVRKEADRWVDLKHHLPEEMARMDQDYRTIRSFDFGPLTSTIQKAEVDWPEKKADLDSRLASLRGLANQSESLWDSTAEGRREVTAGNLGKEDVAGLLNAAETLHGTATALPQKTTELVALTGQLYNSWDKLLVDMDVKGRGDSREYRQQIRQVTTHLADAAAKTGETTSDSQWVTVSRAEYDARKNDLGMAIQHKPAGMYDTEADRVAQPPGFAYMASPAQGRNQYGYWDRRDGRDFWVWYGQYALLRDLLFNRNYRPLDRGDWDGLPHLSRQRPDLLWRIGYCRPEVWNAGQHYARSTYSGKHVLEEWGLRDSQYASKKGSYRDSQYSSPAARNPDFSTPGVTAAARPPLFGRPPAATGRPHRTGSRCAASQAALRPPDESLFSRRSLPVARIARSPSQLELLIRTDRMDVFRQGIERRLLRGDTPRRVPLGRLARRVLAPDSPPRGPAGISNSTSMRLLIGVRPFVCEPG